MHRSNPINNTKLTFIFTNISQSHIGFENISLLPHLFYVLLVTASLAVSLFCLFRKNARPEKKLKFSENRKKGLIGELGQPLSLPQNLRDRFGPNFKPSRHAPFAVFFLLVHCAPFFFGPARVFWAVMVRLNAGDLENMVKTKHFVSDYRSHAEMLQPKIASDAEREAWDEALCESADKLRIFCMLPNTISLCKQAVSFLHTCRLLNSQKSPNFSFSPSPSDLFRSTFPLELAPPPRFKLSETTLEAFLLKKQSLFNQTIRTAEYYPHASSYFSYPVAFEKWDEAARHFMVARLIKMFGFAWPSFTTLYALFVATKLTQLIKGQEILMNRPYRLKITAEKVGQVEPSGSDVEPLSHSFSNTFFVFKKAAKQAFAWLIPCSKLAAVLFLFRGVNQLLERAAGVPALDWLGFFDGMVQPFSAYVTAANKDLAAHSFLVAGQSDEARDRNRFVALSALREKANLFNFRAAVKAEMFNGENCDRAMERAGAERCESASKFRGRCGPKEVEERESECAGSAVTVDPVPRELVEMLFAKAEDEAGGGQDGGGVKGYDRDGYREQLKTELTLYLTSLRSLAKNALVMTAVALALGLSFSKLYLKLFALFLDRNGAHGRYFVVRRVRVQKNKKRLARLFVRLE